MLRFLSPRWLGWHVLMLGAAVACLRLGWWQWEKGRATGSYQSLGYGLQWPLFAAFSVFVWWRVARDAVRPPRAAAPSARRRPPAPRPVRPDPAAGGSPDAEADPELAAYNRYLASLNGPDGKGRW